MFSLLEFLYGESHAIGIILRPQFGHPSVLQNVLLGRIVFDGSGISFNFISVYSYSIVVVYEQGRSTIFRMPIYPMLNQWNANPMTPNPGL